MSGLHEAFDAIAADVPVYGDLDRAIEQADREQRHRNGMVAALAAAAAVVAVIIGLLAVTDDANRSQEPIDPVKTPTTTKSQSPQTWVDTPIAATKGYGWDVPDPLKAARDAWFAVVTEHLDPTGERLGSLDSSPWGVGFDRPGEGSQYSTSGRMGLIVDHGDLNLLDNGCGYLLAEHDGYPDELESCSTERFEGPRGERARISSWGRRCATWDPGREGDDARPGPGSTYVTCGDYAVGVAVERRDGLIGYVLVDGRGTPDFNPFPRAAMAAVAADPRVKLPRTAYAVPSDGAVVSVVEDHFPAYRADEHGASPHHPGYAHADVKLRRLRLTVQVWPAGGSPECGRSWLIDCVERRVFGADDSTTVFVGAWDEEDWADCCPRNSRADSRVFVYVGPRHTVVVSEHLVVRADEEPISADLDQRMIDLALDPRLQ